MTDTDNMDDLAAEYVLGTLDANERANVAFRRQRDPGLAAAIEAWEARLAPLNGQIAPVAPSPLLKDKIVERIRQAESASVVPSNVIDLQHRVARWRSAALGASALAACLAGFIVVRETLKPVAPKSYVAVLQKDAQSPAFLMTVDIAARSFTVRPVAAEPNAGKSYELWLVNTKLGGPKSLGIVGDKPFSTNPKLATFTPGDIEDATYAVSVEPEGGSPTGLPTGPVVYAGKLVQTKP
ncbi:MAG: anti-sigma factor [Hyphomicrobiaceae bacterium]